MQSKIEQRVMASVGTIYTVRRLVSMSALKLYVCVASLYVLGQLVWVSRVFENLSHVGLSGFGQFMFEAVLNTNFLVQATLVVMFVAGISLARDLARSVSPANGTFA